MKSIFTEKSLATNTSWLVGSEITAKASRILVIFSLAALLGPVEYGVVMLALASHEIFKLIQRSGAGAQIIQCDEDKLTPYLQNGIVIQWGLGIGLFVVQSVSSFGLAYFFNMPDLVPLLCGMAIVYLFYPLVSINVFLVQRSNQLKGFSVKNALCIGIENLTIAIAALMGAGIYSIIIGKFAFVIGWLIAFWKTPFDIPKAKVDLPTLRYLLTSSSKILGSEGTRALKNQTDMFVGAKVLSPELFGIYSFAKTAGVNLGQSLSSAFNAAVYPFLCEQRRKLNRNTAKSVYFLCTCLSVCFALQALLVPVYVPILFSQPWQQEYLTISLLCLANIPITWVDTLCNQYRAAAKFQTETITRSLCFVFTVAFYLIWQSHHFYEHAIALLLVNVSLILVFIHPIYQKVNASTPPVLREQ